MSLMEQLAQENFRDPEKHSRDDLQEIIKQTMISGNPCCFFVRKQVMDTDIDWLKENGFKIGYTNRNAADQVVVYGWTDLPEMMSEEIVEIEGDIVDQA